MCIQTLLIGLFSILIFSCEPKDEIEVSNEVKTQTKSARKLNGLSFVASPRPFDVSELEKIQSVHANSVAIMPFGYMPQKDQPVLKFDNEFQWWGEKTEGARETIRLCKSKGLSLMLKPQIWIHNGSFTGFLEMNTEKDWIDFESNYRKFILNFAKLAEEEEVEIYCIGTELGRFVKARPAFWSKLIEDVKQIYSGKLTYAENWDCFDEPKFLKELDYIGVDAYFPLSPEKDPSKEQIKAGWTEHIARMRKCTDSVGLPILFTECGYRSVNYAAEKPWDYSMKKNEVNEDLQARLLEVMFEVVWSKDWLAGGYIWKWFPRHEKSGGPNDHQFTPQNKKAQHTIAVQFMK